MTPPEEVNVRLYNTMSGAIEGFSLAENRDDVRMYNCGPTVYGRQHIGNLAMFVFTDVLRRMLEDAGYPVRQVINFTDFGHLSGDNQGNADEGEDRMTKGLRAEGLALTMENMAILAKKYAHIFLEDLNTLNIQTARITFPYASDFIAEQIEMIRTLEGKGYAYNTPDGVYYDTAKFPAYGALGNIHIEGLREGARVALSSHKRNPTDFILWKSDTSLGWDSPWGRGFPGWHIECSAMIQALLGAQIDIHTGGIEHIAIHHNNEIAQSEAYSGTHPCVRFWMHRAHIQMNGAKISKSEGTALYLSDILDRGFHALSMRYAFLGAHYRTSMNFTLESLSAAETSLSKLVAFVRENPSRNASVSSDYMNRFRERLRDDLDTPGALSVLWTMMKDETLSQAERSATLGAMDAILGLRIEDPDESMMLKSAPYMRAYIALDDLEGDIRELVERRESARKERSWETADALRKELSLRGFAVDDSPDGPNVYTIHSDH